MSQTNKPIVFKRSLIIDVTLSGQQLVMSGDLAEFYVEFHPYIIKFMYIRTTVVDNMLNIP